MAHLEMPGGALQGYWTFNNSANDFSGNGKNMSVTNGSYVDGKIGSHCLLCASNGYATASDACGLTYQGVRTWSLWVYPTALPKSGGNQRSFFFVNTLAFNVQVDMLWNYNGGTYRLEARYINWTVFDVKLNFSTVNAWTHICTTHNGTVYSLYVNGILRGTTTPTGAKWGGAVNSNMVSHSGVDPQAGRYEEYICENRCWSAQEVFRYFSKTSKRAGVIEG